MPCSVSPGIHISPSTERITVSHTRTHTRTRTHPPTPDIFMYIYLCSSLVFCLFLPLEHELHEDGDPVSTDGAAHSPQNPEGRPHPMDLSPTIFAELMKEITFPLNGRGGPISAVPERNQARGRRSQQFHQRVPQFVSAKATRLECARQKRMENNSMEDVNVSVFTHICMFNRPLS